MRSWRIRAPISCAGVTSGLRRCARARPAAGQEHDQDHERHDGVGQSWHLQANVPVRRRGQAGVKADFKRLSPTVENSGVTVDVTDGAPSGLACWSPLMLICWPYPVRVPHHERQDKPPGRWWDGKIYSVTSSCGADFLEASVSERRLLVGQLSSVPLRVSRSPLVGLGPQPSDGTPMALLHFQG
jgi:hypothetical protein